MIWQLIFHMMVLSLTSFAIFYDFKYIKYPESIYNWHYKFGDILTGCIKRETLNSLSSFKNNYFAGLAFPLAIFITLNFWVLYFTKRELIFPSPFKEAIPYWHLHVLHTNVTIYMFMEMFMCFHIYPEFCLGLIIILSFMLFYILWLHFIKYFAGFWVYPFLNDKGIKELYTNFGSALGQVIIIYMLGEILNNSIWSHQLLHKNCVRKSFE
ncbi:androgen-induced gene 1 protein-like isoform 2-T2 [Cochliomyia hominivorax]